MEISEKSVRFSLHDILIKRFGDRLNPQLQRKGTMVTLSHALEEAVLENRLRPVIFTAFQKAEYFNYEAARYQKLSETARAVVLYGQNVPNASQKLEHDWFVVVNEPRFKALLASRELEDQVFEDETQRPFLGIWSYDREVVDYACQVLAGQFESHNLSLARLMAEVLAAPHETLAQIQYVQEVGDRILDELERSNLRAIRQINRNQQLLSDLERQEQALHQVNQRAEIIKAEQSILQGELKKMYAELSRSQQVMTDTIIEKARLEQHNGLCRALLQQLDTELGSLEIASTLSTQTQESTTKMKTLVKQLQKTLSQPDLS